MAFDFFKKRRKDNVIGEPEKRRTRLGALLFGAGTTYRNDIALTLSAVYRSVEVVSDSVAELECFVVKTDSKGYSKRVPNHPLSDMLNNRPNVRMSRFIFWKAMIASMLLRGDAFAWIQRDEKGEPIALHYIPYEWVTIVPPQYIDKPIEYRVVGISGNVQDKDMIHILNFTTDGIYGQSTLTHAKNVLELSHAADKHSVGFFNSGCAVGGILKSDLPLQDEQKKELHDSWYSSFGQSGNPGGLVVLEGGFSYQPVSLSASDSQLIESRRFNLNEVARYFGCSPLKLFDYSNSNYASVEMSQLSFITDTIAPLLAKLEAELTFKLFRDTPFQVKFNANQLIALDKKTSSEYYSRMFNIGCLTTNDIRMELGLPSVENGDVNFVPCNVLSLEKAVKTEPTSNALTTNDEPGDPEEDNKE